MCGLGVNKYDCYDFSKSLINTINIQGNFYD